MSGAAPAAQGAPLDAQVIVKPGAPASAGTSLPWSQDPECTKHSASQAAGKAKANDRSQATVVIRASAHSSVAP
jgi:hypothetical protein